MTKVLIVLGTRPEAIKLAPVIQRMRAAGDELQATVCVTGQHRDMLDGVLQLFAITPDHDLDVMRTNQTLDYLSAQILLKVTEIIHRETPDYLMVQGDTTTAMAACLAAFYQKVKVLHVEAGLRTGDIYNPFPEETNRKIIDHVSHICFAATDGARDQLQSEGIPGHRIEVTGNTVIDALLWAAGRDLPPAAPEMAGLDPLKTTVLITAHRRENFGRPLQQICAAVRTLAQEFSSSCQFVYPVHRNPNVRAVVEQQLSDISNVRLTPPLGYQDFVWLMKTARCILSDSGGIQEEAPSLNTPVVILRTTTERPEAVASGANILTGIRTEDIVRETRRLLTNDDYYRQHTGRPNPYGDGQASERILHRMLDDSAVGTLATQPTAH